MATKKPNPDAAKAREHARAAEGLIDSLGADAKASVHASLAVYYQLKAASTGEQGRANEMLARQMAQQQ